MNMIKSRIPHSDSVESDRLISTFLGDNNLRAVFANCTTMIREMKANHGLQIAETLILGSYYMAASLLSANIKEEDIIRLQINCEGPLGGLNVESDYRHNVRGYLINNPIPVNNPGAMSLSDYFGEGVLSVTRLNRLTNKPFTGQISMPYGVMAKDLAYYYTASEQLATAFKLDIAFNNDGSVAGAGGLLVQALPGTREELLIKAEEIIGTLPSLGTWFSLENNTEQFIENHFQKMNPQILAMENTEFYCDCNKERIAVHISALPDSDKEEILTKEEYPIHSKCHNCGTDYYFPKEEAIPLLMESNRRQ